MMLIIHILLILTLFVPALYYFVFAVAGRLRRKKSHAAAPKSRFCILIPAYKSDGFILATVKAALSQDYPSGDFRVLVISDGMRPETEAQLRKEGAEVLSVCFRNSTKAASLCAAMKYFGPEAADYAAVLDSDNIVRPDFLSRMNDALAGRRMAVQGHRCAKNTDTPVAMADGIFEEVNNLVFRQGHCALGLSSALIGSGMCLPYEWLRLSSGRLETAGEDKELELMLLKDGIFVEYEADIDILDEKTRSISNLQKQRLRWLRSQYFLIGSAFRELPQAELKAGFADKLFQWAFIPRILIILGLPLVTLLAFLLSSGPAFLYLAGCLMLFTAILLGMPGWIKASDILGILLQVPKMLGATLHNIFAKKSGKDNYIHTDHE